MIKVCLLGADVSKEHALLGSQADISVTLIEPDDFDCLLDTISKKHPDILVLSDVNSDIDMDAICLHTYLRHPDISTLIITEQDADYARLESTGFSCKGFMLHQQRHSIVRAVMVVNDGEAWLSRKLVTTVLNQLATSVLETRKKPRLIKNK